MAITSPNIYVRSTDGSDVSDGGTFADAKASIAGAAAIDTTTDKRIWLSNAHAESLAAAQAWSFAGTVADPTWVVAVSDTSEPPTTLSTASASTTGANAITITGNVYFYGVTINNSNSPNNANLNIAQGTGVRQTFENCAINLRATNASNRIVLGAASQAPQICHLLNTNISFGAVGQGFAGSGGNLLWEGGAVSGGTAPTTALFRNGNSANRVSFVCNVSGVDLSGIGSSCAIFEAGTNATHGVVRNCKLPASWTGALITGTLLPDDRCEMYNCDNSDTNYRVYIQDYAGSIIEETAVYNDAGVDTTGIESTNADIAGFSWKMVSSANAEFPHQRLASPEIVKWNETVTGTLTATVEIVHNSQGAGTAGALLDNEIWLEVMCMDPGGTPIGKWQSDRCANLNLNSNAADQSSSGASWTGDSAGWDTQKLSVSFTPKEKGYVHARVCLAKASATVYVDPLLTIT